MREAAHADAAPNARAVRDLRLANGDEDDEQNDEKDDDDDEQAAAQSNGQAEDTRRVAARIGCLRSIVRLWLEA